MLPPNAQLQFAEFVERHGLKPRSGVEYGGLCQGMGIIAWEAEGVIHVHAFSPAVQITADMVLDGFSDFAHLQEAGISNDWIAGTVVDGTLDLHSCEIKLTPEQLEQLPRETFLRLPELLSRDLELRKINSDPILCSQCQSAVAQQLYPAKFDWQFRCDSCSFAVGEIEVPVRWGRAALALVGSTLAFAFVWGLLQQPAAKGHNAKLMLFAPFVGSVILCRFVARAAEGTSLMLRLITAAGILLGVLAGNVWGYRSWLAQQGAISWPDAIEAYVRGLPANTNAGWYILGGLAGVWVSFGVLKANASGGTAATSISPR